MSGLLVQDLVTGILRAVEPIDIALKSKETFMSYLAQHGINITLSDSDFQKITAGLNLTDSFNNSQSLFQQSESSGNENAEILTGIISVVKTIITEIKILTQGSPDNSLPAPLDQDIIWQKLGRETIDRLTYEAIEEELPILALVLLLTGIAEINPINITAPGIIPYTQYIMNWEKLGDFIKDPLTQIKQTYGWGDNVTGFNYKRFYYYMQRALTKIGFFSRLEIPESTFLNKFYSAGNTDRNSIRILKVPIHMEFAQNFSSFAEVGFQSMPIPESGDTNGKPMGFTLAPLFKGGFTATPAEDTSTGISLQVSAGLETDAFFRLLIRPSGVSFESDSAATSVNAEIALKGRPETPYILIGSAGSHRVELEGFLVSVGFRGNLEDPEFIVKAGTGQGSSAPKLKFIFQAGESDGFLKSILGEEPKSIDLSGLLVWSSKHGIGFEGTAGFSILIPLHLALGPINIDAIAIDASVGTNSDPKIGLGINLSGTLGPLSFVCEQIGAQIKFASNNDTDKAGLFGNLNFEWGFQPPKGLGLSINAGAVIGGGYLFFDFEKEEYAGALELTIAGFISAKAIGLITTKMPDGSKGFSMLIIISAEFLPPFQLGYGFTLIGVGGLLGLNRTMLLDPLRNAVRTGAVNSIMFPQNVIANAPRIISDLKAIFPPYEGKFLIGPMGKLGWGTPTLISLSLGLIIEIPGNIAILGNLKVALPEEHIPLIQIQVLFVGTIDFDKQMLTFDASLYDSFILFMTLEGDMALRLKWGDHPDFILTVGGFHPSYTPPPLALPTLRRLAINILDTSIAKIRVECYQAVTSNTVQFGAKAEFSLDLSVCAIEGHIGFDALFQFSPFHFIIEVSASFKLSAFGIDVVSVRVHMSLEGPTPWRARGTGSVSFFFFDISADFDITWGDEKNTSLPDIIILPRFIEELNKREQWSTALTAGKKLLVTLRKFKETSPPLLILHPSGSLIIQQKLLPLLVNITKVGNQKTSDVKQVKIAHASSNGVDLLIKDINEDFARAQYQDLTDAEKLSKPSFEKMPGGVSVSMSDGNYKNGSMVRKIIEYEITIIDKEPGRVPKWKKKVHRLKGGFFDHLIKNNSASRSVLSKNYAEKLQPFTEKITANEELFTVAFQENNKAMNAAATFPSEIMAQTYMQEQVSKDPSLKNAIHIIPNHEMQEL